MNIKVGSRIETESIYGKNSTGTVVAIRSGMIQPLLIEIDKEFKPTRRVQRKYNRVKLIK